VSKRIIAGYVAALIGLACVLVLVPSAGSIGWPIVGLISASAMVFGVRRNRPERAAPWLLLAFAVLAGAVGDALYTVGGTVGHFSEASYLVMFPLIAASLANMTRASAVLRDRSRLLGTLMFTCAIGLVSWVLVLSPMLRVPALPAGQKSVIAAYLLGDLLIVVVAGRLLLAAPASMSLVLLGLGAAGGLVSDLAYAAATFTGPGWAVGGPAELGYLTMYGAWGAAALHPTMAHLTAPAQTRPPRVDGRWLAAIGVSLAVPPAVLLVESLGGQVRDGLMIAIVSTLIYVLAFTQLADAARAHRQSLVRERGLRRAAGALVAATAPAEVGAAVRVAIGRLMPAGTRHAVHFSDVVSADEPGTSLATVAQLPAAARVELDGFAEAIVCPLLPRRRGAARPEAPAGTVTVAADGRVLADARDAIETLAAQARLALERIALTEAINRRDSDRYLRTMIENTTDIVLVIDEDHTIRYASPALHRVLGLALPPSGRLSDLVGADEQARVAETIERAGEVAGDVEDGVGDSWHLRRNDGSRVVVDVSCRDLRDDRMVRGFVLTLRDVTLRQERVEEQIRQALRGRAAGHNRHNSANKFR
jgi:PAS domain S-box-containing protein